MGAVVYNRVTWVAQGVRRGGIDAEGLRKMRTLDEAGVISDQDRLLLHEVKHIVRRLLPTADVLLYGSVARGTQDAESDYDILVLTDSPISKEDRCEIERMLLDLELLRDVILSTIYHSRSEWASHSTWPFHTEVEKHGIAL